MKTPLIILAVVLLLMGGGLYYQFLYPPSVMEKNAEAALLAFADVVESQDRAKIATAMDALLTDDAKIHLTVAFSAINQANAQPMEREYNKATFITFIDNLLATLTDYHFRPKLQEFTLNDNKIADVLFLANQSADGPSYFEGVTLTMRFSGNTECRGQVIFDNNQPRLGAANCNVLLRSTTKPDAAGGAINQAQELRKMLDEHQP